MQGECRGSAEGVQRACRGSAEGVQSECRRNAAGVQKESSGRLESVEERRLFLDPDDTEWFTKVIVNDLPPTLRRSAPDDLCARPLFCAPSVERRDDLGEGSTGRFSRLKQWRRGRHLASIVGALADG